MGAQGEQADSLPLTPRQLEIFGLVAKGLSNREICELLGISNNTVKIHVAAILRNLNVANRTEAVFAYKEMLEETSVSHDGRRLEVSDRIGRPAIAVLPFTNLAPTEDDEHICEGVVEELLDRLSSWQWFPVIAYGSSRHVEQEALDIATAGEQLGASYLITGTLRRSDNQARVSARIVQVASGQSVWSRSFDVATDDLFALQSDIAQQIVLTIAPELIDAEAQNISADKAADFTTWQLVCKGTWHLNRSTAEDTEQAYALFTEALERDPNFGLAWAGRVGVNQKRIFDQTAVDARQCGLDLLADAQACMRVEPRAAYSHSCLGAAFLLTGNNDAAITHLEQAIAINPSSSRALVALAQAYGMNGRLEECIMHAEELVRLDPMSPSSFRHRAILGVTNCVARDFEEAIRWGKSAVAHSPQRGNTYLPLIAGYVGNGQLEEAKQTVTEMRIHAPDFKVERHMDFMRFSKRELLDPYIELLRTAGLEIGEL